MWLNERPKVEESKITGTQTKLFFLQRLKPEFVNITRTKSGINPILKVKLHNIFPKN